MNVCIVMVLFQIADVSVEWNFFHHGGHYTTLGSNVKIFSGAVEFALVEELSLEDEQWEVGDVVGHSGADSDASRNGNRVQ